ncbi:Receptor-type tyrosine-protein phosphatase alpha [Geodia barretti]|uniref:protein-tyrosine-phosphatase n=2 Tax=Geodia barretti TaxID=519541 RepID=A0AA35S4A9_GEOBA|nr:Receptor-type tyrosine-protein phosphatase alpha [Geodia barretti]
MTPPSIHLTWTPPTPLGATTGYRISFTGGGNSGSVDVSGGSTDNYTLTGLMRGEMYNISIVGISEHFFSQSVAWDTVKLPEREVMNEKEQEGGKSNSRQGGNAGSIAAGVLVPLILVAVIATLVVVTLIWLKRRQSNGLKNPLSVIHQTFSAATSPSVNNVTMDHSTKLYKRPNDKIPAIVQFPKDTHVQEGEAVLFQVKVKADYSRDLAGDGSLTLPSTELKHSGVYRLVAHNSVGRVEQEVRLTVGGEGQITPSSNKPTSVPTAPIPVSQLGNHVENKHKRRNQGFNEEYQSLYDGRDKTISIATNSENKLKNRFGNICVYDDHRVQLTPLPGHPDCQTDYINACYVDGYSTPSKFLATQGPLPKTLVDFWRLVWQERPPSIVMITKLEEGGKIKCQRYWPQTGRCNFGPFEVTLTDEQIFADYTTRRLEAQLEGGSGHPLKVAQFHFTAWPDHGVPDYATPLLAFHRRVIKEHNPRKRPLMVHCSAGVGRTGAFITIDHVLEQLGREKMVDIPCIINKIRHQRMKMVQTVDQYVFIHDAILERVVCGDTQIEASNLRMAIIKLKEGIPGESSYHQQFSILEKVSPNPKEVKSVAGRSNPKKNRNMEFLPVDKIRVVLKGETPDYINATFVHGYKQQRAFIIAQSPMESTARDFWKMVWDRKCGVMVMLCHLEEAGREVCYQYWPSSGSKAFGEFTVELLGEQKLTGFITRNLTVINNKSKEVQQLCQFHITNWAPDGSCSRIKTVIDVILEVTKVQIRTSNKPIVIHCSDTVSRSGMFCAILTTIERCKTEGVVDVFQVVKALRVQKPGAVLTVGQYMTVFEAVLVFLDSFDTYSNFGPKQ